MVKGTGIDIYITLSQIFKTNIPEKIFCISGKVLHNLNTKYLNYLHFLIQKNELAFPDQSTVENVYFMIKYT